MNPITLSIECDSEPADSLAAVLADLKNCSVTAVEKNNLDGSLPTILQYIEVAASAVSAISSIVSVYVANKSVKKIKFGDFEIENPTREQWEKLWDKYLSSHIEGAPKN